MLAVSGVRRLRTFWQHCEGSSPLVFLTGATRLSRVVDLFVRRVCYGDLDVLYLVHETGCMVHAETNNNNKIFFLSRSQ